MAQLTRAQARSLIQQLIDDPAAKLWSAANLDILTEGALDELWGELLDAFAWVRSTETTALTPTSPGYINLDTAVTRFYRLQQVGRNGSSYQPADPKDVVVINSEQVVGNPGTYSVEGNRLWLFPLDMTANVFIKYASRPTAFTALASDATAVDWPDGYHMAYIYDAASRAMEKGDREASERFKARADMSLLRLKGFLRKQSVGPVMPWMPDSGRDWGSVT